MHEHRIFLIIGGDHRYIYVIKQLASHGHTVYTIGFKDNTFTEKNIIATSITTVDLQSLTHIVLPVEGMSADFEILCHFTGEKIAFTTSLISATKKGCTFFTGTANESLHQLLNEVGRRLVVLFDRDDVAIYNSIPTAEATLQIAMEKTDVTIHGSNILITGLGRIGVTIARLFHHVGANVTVAVRKAADRARAVEMGLGVCSFAELKEVAKAVHVCVNTVPALVIGEEVIEQMPRHAFLIDLASKPGGIDFVAAGKRGIRAIHALGLPGNVAPRTAGKIIADTILRN